MTAGTSAVDGPHLTCAGDHWVVRFRAMASPCEVLIDGACGATGEALAWQLGVTAFDEAQRIERKFSRYRTDGVVAQIHGARGKEVEVDDETTALINYAETCTRASRGSFDITSGVLRHAWRFDGSDRVPAAERVAALQARVGWQRVSWQAPRLRLPADMEIDFGGIGKEYAVDRTVALLRRQAAVSVLVNFGGDLRVSGPRADGTAWVVGIDDPEWPGAAPCEGDFALTCGAAATSGDAFRFLVREGRRYGHVLDARTGWPVEQAPRSVTVLAPTCIEAGTLATLAMLKGAAAEEFLRAQDVRFWCRR